MIHTSLTTSNRPTQKSSSYIVKILLKKEIFIKKKVLQQNLLFKESIAFTKRGSTKSFQKLNIHSHTTYIGSA